MNDRNAKPSAIAEEAHRIYSWEDVRFIDFIVGFIYIFLATFVYRSNKNKKKYG